LSHLDIAVHRQRLIKKLGEAGGLALVQVEQAIKAAFGLPYLAEC